MDREPIKLMDLIMAMPSTTLCNCIFKNNHDLTFPNRKDDWGMIEPGISSGAVYADLDNDGDLALIVNRINSSAGIYRDMQQDEKKTPYLSVRLRYKNANGNAVGSKVYVYSNGTMQYEEANPNQGCLSCLPSLHILV